MRTKLGRLTCGALLALGLIGGFTHSMGWAIDEREGDVDRAARSRDRDDGNPRTRGGEGRASGDAQSRFAPGYVPILPDRDRRWQLGVYIANTSKGVMIRGVLPGSAAARSGLEQDDTIVSVAGYQVGRVGNVTYDLGDELQLRASSRGDVLLLVHNHRNGELVNVDVRLTPWGAVLRERSRSPRGFDNEPESGGELR